MNSVSVDETGELKEQELVYVKSNVQLRQVVGHNQFVLEIISVSFNHCEHFFTF